MKKFEECSYLSQVRRLRVFAYEALKKYSIGKYELKFVQHGENSVFKVRTSKQDYLLRIHRRNYHSKQAINEELKWLEHLDQKSEVEVQRPIKSRNGQLVNHLHSSLVGDRFFNLLTWKDGIQKYKKNERDFFRVGSLLANLQRNTIKSKHRQYWTSSGLVGRDATFGGVHLLRKDYPKAYDILEPCRKEVLRNLQKYESRKSAKLGLMHADLHFGNMIWHKGGISPIDFDDCGYGIQIYDLAVNFYNSSNFFKRIGKKQTQKMKYSLIEGFNSIRPLSDEDIAIIPDLVRARDILMIVWLYMRQDNPVIKEHLDKELMNKVRRVRSNKLYKI